MGALGQEGCLLYALASRQLLRLRRRRVGEGVGWVECTRQQRMLLILRSLLLLVGKAAHLRVCLARRSHQALSTRL